MRASAAFSGAKGWGMPVPTGARPGEVQQGGSHPMKRRGLLGSAGVAAAAATTAAVPLAAPAIAQTMPEIRWRLTSAFPRTLETLFGAGDMIGRVVGEMTEGRFRIQVFPTGELVPTLGAMEAVQNGTVEANHCPNYYFFGKQAALAFDTGIPFGLNARQQNAWMFYGGGLELMHEVLKPFNTIAFPAGNTGTQMGGFFRKEVRTLDDLKGLKFRIAGLGGTVMQRLGAVPQLLPAGDIYPALERGTIGAAEWVGPYDDEKLGFYKVAKFYYYPSWWEPGPTISFYINKEQWEKLPKPYQTAFETAASEANLRMMAAYDAKNPPAIQRLVQNGVQLRRYPDDAMKAAYEAAQKIYAEESARNPDFKKIYDSQRAFQQVFDIWMGLAENTLANFMQSQLRAKK